MGFLVVSLDTDDDIESTDALYDHLTRNMGLHDSHFLGRVFRDDDGTPHLLNGFDIQLEDGDVLMLKIQYPSIVGYFQDGIGVEEREAFLNPDEYW